VSAHLKAKGRKVKRKAVGGGLSGLSAAHTIYQRGGNVLVIDKNGL
jgi:succinate dehydrogenase/fumarate reductase flavoprotein subunit